VTRSLTRLVGLLLRFLLAHDDLRLFYAPVHNMLGQFFAHAHVVDQRTFADLFDVSHIDEAERHDLVDHFLVDAFDFLERLIEALDVRLEFGRGEDVDVPARQACGESDVLPALADRQ